MVFKKNKIKNFGLGLGLRSEMHQSTLDFFKSEANKNLLEWAEIIPENYIDKGGKSRRKLDEALAADLPLIPHSVSISIGTAPKTKGDNVFNPRLISGLKEIFQEVKPPWFSDHLSFSYVDGIYLEDLIPLPRTQEVVSVVADNVKWLQDEFQLPFLIENPSYYSTITEPEMSEADFFNKILEQADCGMLLDVNNIYVNATNHKYDAHEFLKSIDLDRVVQVHIAGHDSDYTTPSGEFLKILDTHGNPIIPEVYTLLDELLSMTSINAILLERDGNFPEDFSDLLEELKQIRMIMNKHSLVEV